MLDVYCRYDAMGRRKAVTVRAFDATALALLGHEPSYRFVRENDAAHVFNRRAERGCEHAGPALRYRPTALLMEDRGIRRSPGIRIAAGLGREFSGCEVK